MVPLIAFVAATALAGCVAYPYPGYQSRGAYYGGGQYNGHPEYQPPPNNNYGHQPDNNYGQQSDNGQHGGGGGPR
jgi:hypothetical protein